MASPGTKPQDYEVFNYLVRQADCCSDVRGVLEAFPQFHSQSALLNWIKTRPQNVGRKLFSVDWSAPETLVSAWLNGIRMCVPYRYGKMCKDTCKKIHICWYQLQGHCYKKSKCPRSHNIKDSHNTRILSEWHLTDLDSKLVLKALRSIAKSKDKQKRQTFDETPSEASEATPDVQLDEENEDLDEVEIFRTILRKYDGECSVVEFIMENPDLGTEEELREFFTNIEEDPREDDWFGVRGGRISLFLPGMLLCTRYTKKSCQVDQCQRLHICKFRTSGFLQIWRQM